MIVLTPKNVVGNYTRMSLNRITPSRLEALTVQQIEHLHIAVDEQSVPLGRWWDVSEIAGSGLRLCGDCGRCDEIGGGMEGGTLHVMGNVGEHLAHNMRSGTITVDGHAGRYACSALKGGHVEVHGDVGEFAAAALPGQSRGMRGGVFIIHGSCDRWLAARMRRGTVIAMGNVADGCASRMIAGTVVMAAAVESPLGVGMRRGTLLLLSPTPEMSERLTPGFTSAEECELSYLPLLWNGIERYLPPTVIKAVRNKRTYRSVGDRAVGGLGECIWLADSHCSYTDAQSLIS